VSPGKQRFFIPRTIECLFLTYLFLQLLYLHHKELSQGKQKVSDMKQPEPLFISTVLAVYRAEKDGFEGSFAEFFRRVLIKCLTYRSVHIHRLMDD